MNLLELVSKRRSVREYLPTEVEPEKIDYLMECARLAPSAVNYQPWKFIIVKSTAAKEQLQQCYSREWFVSAPVYIVVVADKSQSWKRKFDEKDYYDVDAAIAAEHIALAATEQGLGTCWVCNFDPGKCKAVLGLSENEAPVVILTLGYPAKEQEKVSNRKPVQEIVKEL